MLIKTFTGAAKYYIIFRNISHSADTSIFRALIEFPFCCSTEYVQLWFWVVFSSVGWVSTDLPGSRNWVCGSCICISLTSASNYSMKILAVLSHKCRPRVNKV